MRNRLSVVLPFAPPAHTARETAAVDPIRVDDDPTLEIARDAMVRIMAGPPRRTFLQLLEQLIAG